MWQLALSGFCLGWVGGVLFSYFTAAKAFRSGERKERIRRRLENEARHRVASPIGSRRV